MNDAYILIVDDEPDMHTLLTLTLRPLGLHFEHARNGSDALARIASCSCPPSVIILDLMMPGMNGYEFLAHMERSPNMAAIPVVVYSANPRPSWNGRSAWPSQVMDVIEKTALRPAALRDRVQRAMMCAVA